MTAFTIPADLVVYMVYVGGVYDCDNGDHTRLFWIRNSNSSDNTTRLFWKEKHAMAYAKAYAEKHSDYELGKGWVYEEVSPGFWRTDTEFISVNCMIPSSTEVEA